MKNTTLFLMNYIFNPDGFDWMNFKVTKNNPYTYHHIVEKRNGGGKTIDNGAILTLEAHTLLNMLERYHPDIYEELQVVFRRINASKLPPTEEDIKEIDLILYRVLFTTETNDMKKNKIIKLRKEYLRGRKEIRNYFE